MSNLRQHRRAIALLLVAGLLLALVLVGYAQADRLRSLASFRQVDDHPLYVMHIYGDYGFDEFLETSARSAAPSYLTSGQDAGAWACTCLATKNASGETLFGRNFDWYNRPSLLLYTHPPAGYASVSMVDVSYLGLDGGKPSWEERRRLLDAPYLPFDGMNEAGLGVGMMALAAAEPPHDPAKVTLDSLHVIRLFLDRAATVDEALALLARYNVDWGGGPPLHYLIADRQGYSAVVEFVDGELKVLRGQNAWQVATNFPLWNRTVAQGRSLCQRYDRASEVLEQARGNLGVGQVMSLLQDVSQELTMWSVVYDLATGHISVAVGRDYAQVHEFSLNQQ